MGKNLCYLNHNDFASFLSQDIDSIFGTLCDNYYGGALTTTREACRNYNYTYCYMYCAFCIER